LTSDDAVTQQKDINRKAEVTALFRKPEMRLLCFAMFMIYFGMFSPFFYTPSYATAKGVSSSFAFYTVSIVNGASFFGRILPGIIADKYGKFNCCVVCTLLAGIVALCWTRVESVAGLGVWAAAYGFASGVSMSRAQLFWTY
jgi:predicted MFS family arabinose efflux permease